MKKFLLVILTSIFTSLSIAQINQQVMDQVKTYPSAFKLYEHLSERITNDFNNDRDRAAAIYVWMATHIKYDVKAFFSGRVQRSARITYRNEAERIQKELALRQELAMETLQKKKAVCQGYSELYQLLCKACGIECEVVVGYSRSNVNNIGKVPRQSDHAWNVIRLDNNWLFVDVTWGAGHVDHKTRKFVPAFTSDYFAVEAEAFSYNHYSEESKWNFTGLTLKSFAEQVIAYHSFFGMGLELISPRQGLIKKMKKGRIVIEFKNITSEKHQYNYGFHGMKHMQPVEVQEKRSKGDFINRSGEKAHGLPGYYR